MHKRCVERIREMRGGAQSHKSLRHGPLAPALPSSSTIDHRQLPDTFHGNFTGQRQAGRRAIFRGLLHFSEENLLQKTAGVKHQKECPSGPTGVAEGHVQPTEKCIPLCPQTFLRAQDWEWGEGGSGVDQVQSSLSSLSVAEDATSEPMEATSAEVSTNRESFSFPLVPVLGGEGSQTAGMSVESGRGIRGRGFGSCSWW